jgi:Rieske Fe-S protein
VIDDTATFEERVPETSGLGRRTLLRGAAITGLAVPLVAACGSSNDKSSTSPKPNGSNGSTDDSSSANSGDSSGSSGGGKELTSTSAIPKGGGKVFADEKAVVTQPKSGEFKCFTAVCTHMGCIVHDVSGGTINCACHGSRYNITTGAVEGGPAPAPLAAKPIKVQGNEIILT